MSTCHLELMYAVLFSKPDHYTVPRLEASDYRRKRQLPSALASQSIRPRRLHLPAF